MHPAIAPTTTRSSRRRSLLLAVVVAAALLGAACEPENPVDPLDAPDPSVLRADDAWYAYATGAYGLKVQVFRSAGMDRWERIGQALPTPPSWAVDLAGMMWAPAVERVDDRFVLYVSVLHRTNRRMCIISAIADDPAGPFVADEEPLVCDPELGGSIDPEPFVDADGQRWLLWKSDGSCCRLPNVLWSQRLSDDGRRLVGQRTKLLTPAQPWELGMVESPSLVRIGRTLHLTWSSGWWDASSYAVGHAVCDTPAGPCTRTGTSPVLRSTGAVAGPGGQDVFVADDGTPWMVYAAWDAATIGTRFAARTIRFDPVHVEGSRLVVEGPTVGARG